MAMKVPPVPSLRVTNGSAGSDILIFGGGTISTDDIPALKAAGLAAVFTPGTTTTEAIQFVKANIKRKT